jgi:PIN domain nuclease of toxin-antitoxin system
MEASALPLLLDTHLLLWLAVDPPRLPEALREELADRRQPLLFSVVSLWEVAIKTSLNRPGFQVDALDLRQGLLREGFVEQPIEAAHCVAVQHLPWIHRDPFDRLLVAQARCEGLILLSVDRVLQAYGPEVRWIGAPPSTAASP